MKKKKKNVSYFNFTKASSEIGIELKKAESGYYYVKILVSFLLFIYVSLL